MTDDTIKFLASFPAIQSAIKITGDGNGLRIQLDIPETEMGEAAKLILLRECVLEVHVKKHHDPKKSTTGSNATTIKRTTAKQRK